jgi:hypothetical protein
MDKDLYLDWLNDNREDLVEDFLDLECDRFSKYCMEEFNNYLCNNN